ncbi:MAG: pilus assembly protein [Acidobacteriia bacterium]|nr:pilus assembly protein [Terriglobia bacterium]
MSFESSLGAARFTASSLRDDRAAQIVEFAVALPLLIVFVVGIYDFSSAFTLKQRLTNIARDAARAAAADPTNDLQSPSGTIPISVNDAFQIVDNSLLANKINDCSITNTASPSGLTWTFTASGNGCVSPGLTMVVNRGYYYPSTGATLPNVNCTSQAPGSGQVAIISTCVSIRYAYPWRFGQAASLLGRNTVLPKEISAIAVAMNEN